MQSVDKTNIYTYGIPMYLILGQMSGNGGFSRYTMMMMMMMMMMMIPPSWLVESPNDGS